MNWLDRALVISPYYYCLAKTEKEYLKECKRMAIPAPQPFLNEGAHATTHYFLLGDGRRIAIVCVGKHKARTKHQINALLVHEAVHIWQEIKAELGETNPSKEFEAYGIQNIAQALMEEWWKK